MRRSPSLFAAFVVKVEPATWASIVVWRLSTTDSWLLTAALDIHNHQYRQLPDGLQLTQAIDS
jgi:hypothetical protein